MFLSRGIWRKDVWADKDQATLFTALEVVELGEQSLNMRWTNISGNGQLHSENQTAYTPRVNRSHISKVCNHRDKQHEAKPYFPREGYKQITIDSIMNNLE